MADKVSLEGLDKAAVFAALYNAARPQGLGFKHYSSSTMSTNEARTRFGPSFGEVDYVDGRVMKVDLSGEVFDPWLYDRDNGAGAAATVVNLLRSTGQVNNDEIAKLHNDGTRNAAEQTKAGLGDEDQWVTTDNGVAVFGLGLSDYKDDLKPTLDEILRRLGK